jgi:hypothetical protein
MAPRLVSMLLLVMVLAFTVGTYAACGASQGTAVGQAAYRSSAAASREEQPRLDDLRYLVGTFRGVNDHIVAEIRRLDALNGALLGGVVAIFVLFLDKVEYWPALPALVVPAVLLLHNARDTMNYAPDPDVFAEHYEADRKLALHDLMNDYKRYIVENGDVLDNKRAGAADAVLALRSVPCRHRCEGVYFLSNRRCRIWANSSDVGFSAGSQSPKHEPSSTARSGRSASIWLAG